MQSLRAGAVDDLGLGWDDARRINPRLVYCSITAFGVVGPLVDRPGYDPLMQAYGGIMSVNGHRGQAPARVAMSIIDMGTGVWAVTAILAALRERDRTGRGTHVTTALFDTAIATITVQMSSYLATGDVPEPQGSGTQMIAPYEAFPTRDAWVMVGAASDALFASTCAALGLADLPADPRYASNPGRVTHRAQLFDAIAAVTRTLTTDDLLARLQRAGVPSAPILKLDQVAALPQTKASGMLVSAKHPRLDDYRGVGCPFAGTASDRASRACPRSSASTPPRCWPSSASTTPPSRTWETAMSSSYEP